MMLLLAACDEICPRGEVCTVAGTGDLGFNGEDLPALESWLYFPASVRKDPQGRIAFSDFNNMRIRAIAEDGTLETVAGNGDHAWSTPGMPPLESALENPMDALWAPDGTLYILLSHEARMVRIVPGGVIEVIAGTGDIGYTGDGGPAASATMSEPYGMALDTDGTLYVADTSNNVIRAVGTDGTIRTLAGTGTVGLSDGTPATFSGPRGIALSDDHVLYVADTNNQTVRAVDCDTGVTTTVVGTGVAGYAGDGGDASEAQLNYPTGVAVDGDTLWIADSGNNVIRRVQGGEITTWAGTGEAGRTDGPVEEATFNFPLAILPDGDLLYVADFISGLIRVIRAPA